MANTRQAEHSTTGHPLLAELFPDDRLVWASAAEGPAHAVFDISPHTQEPLFAVAAYDGARAGHTGHTFGTVEEAIACAATRPSIDEAYETYHLVGGEWQPKDWQ